MMAHSLSLHCTGPELFYLSTLLGGKALVGVEDPFPGWLTEEIQEQMIQTQRDLVERGCIEWGPDYEIHLDAGAAALIGAMTFPAAVFTHTLTHARGVSLQETFYWQSPMTVKLSRQESGYRLDFLDDPEAIYRQVVDSWEVEEQPAAPGEALVLPESVLEKVRGHVDQEHPEAAIDALAQTGTSEAAAHAVVDTLRTLRRNGSILALRLEGRGWYPAGLGMLQGENGMWCLRSFERSGEPWIEFLPSDTSELVAALQRLMARFIPLELAT